LNFAFVADIHFHNWPNFRRVSSSGLNSRLEDIVDVMIKIAEKSKVVEVSHIFLLGDVFHSRTKLDMDVVSTAVNCVKTMKDISGAEIVILLGNHDIHASNQNVHILKIFEPFCTVIDKPGVYPFAKTDVFALPYIDNAVQLKKHIRHLGIRAQESDAPCKIMISHNGLNKALVGPNEFFIEDPVTVEETNPELFNICLYGHYHKHQQLGDNVFYVGSPLQHTFGERGDDKGFVTYHTSTHQSEFIAVDSPKFVQCSPENAKEEIAKGNYVKVELGSDEEKAEYLADADLKALPFVDNSEEDAEYDVRLDLTKSNTLVDMIRYDTTIRRVFDWRG